MGCPGMKVILIRPERDITVANDHNRAVRCQVVVDAVCQTAKGMGIES